MDLTTGIEKTVTYDIDVSIFDALNEFDSNDYLEEFESIRGLSISSEYTQVTNTNILPYSAIGFMRLKLSYIPLDYGYCTAFMISKNVAVTSAHCLYDNTKGKWIKSAQFYPGKKGFGIGNDPFGATYVEAMAISTDYMNKNYTSSTSCDWGLVRLHDNIGLECGYIPFVDINMYALNGQQILISGYPQYSIDSLEINYSQYKVNSSIMGCTYDDMYIPFNCYHGMSGSPVITSDGNVCGIIATTGAYATKITSTVAMYFNQYITQSS